MRKTILYLLAFLAVYSFLQFMILELDQPENWSGQIQLLTQDTFDSAIADSPPWMVVHVWAPWCSICKQAKPDYNLVAAEYQGDIGFYHLNLDENPEWVEMYQMNQGVPTSVIFYKGQEIARHPGRLSPSLMRNWIRHTTGLEADPST